MDKNNPLLSSEIQKITFYSKSLDQEKKMNVYLPKGYSSAVHYPVLYLIHGYTGNETDWIPGLGIDQAADKLIEAGKIVPLIMVSPELDNSYGINSSQTYSVTNTGDPYTTYNGMYEDYLYKDVIGYVDSHYSTLAKRESRYIGGLSMGGFISLHTAFLHTDMFSKVGGHSPALFLNDWSTTGGENGLKSFLYPTDTVRQTRDPLILAQNLNSSKMKVYLDCGDQDDFKFYEGSEKLYSILKAKGVSVEYHLNKGKHNGDYWKSMVDNYLQFYVGK
ncbi:esterase [Paenibacillus selenitireducens]|uniref:Esterase n=2 Tax=Paenibacillus selenitireducens TaxID=1324314 RepID=A0A1T2WZM8_9BACL|nr:esterase [Paenibacillus selenitireducens]